MTAETWRVAKKEILEIVRDKRSLFVVLLLPVILYPLLIIGTVMASTAQVRRMADETFTVWVPGLDEAPGGLKKALSSPPDPEQGLTLRLGLLAPPPEHGDDYTQDLAERRISVVLRGAAAVPSALEDGRQVELEVLYNDGVDVSRAVRLQVERRLRRWGRELAEARLEAAALPPESTLEPVITSAENLGREGAPIGRILATIVVVLGLTGAFYPALDLGAGEKERGTLETLLLAPVPRVTIALGKFVAVTVFAALSAILNLASLTITFLSLGSATGKIGFELEAQTIPLVLLVLLPLSALFGALALAVSTFAASYKEGQAYLSPLLITGTMLASAAFFPGVALTPVTCLVPVAGSALLIKELLAGTAGVSQVLLVTLASLAYAFLAIRWVASLYEKEEVLWRPAAAQAPDLLGLRRQPGSAGEPLPTLPQAVTMAIVVLLGIWFVGRPLQTWSLTAGLALTLIGVILAPGLIYAAFLGCDLRQTFAWQRPPLRFMLIPLPLALATPLLALRLVDVQGGGAEPPPELAELSRQILSLPPALLLVLVAVLPAVCEEALFRGFVMQGLRKEGGDVAAVLVSALAFALAHLDPARVPPTFFLGVLLGVLTLRSGSLLPAILLHFCHNALATASSGLTPEIAEWLFADESRTRPSLQALLLALLILGLGLVVILLPTRRVKGD